MPEPRKPDLDRTDLTAASAEEVAEALSYALRYDERGSGGFAAGIAAERLVEHLRRAGFSS